MGKQPLVVEPGPWDRVSEDWRGICSWVVARLPKRKPAVKAKPRKSNDAKGPSLSEWPLYYEELPDNKMKHLTRRKQ